MDKARFAPKDPLEFGKPDAQTAATEMQPALGRRAIASTKHMETSGERRLLPRVDGRILSRADNLSLKYPCRKPVICVLRELQEVGPLLDPES